MMNRLAAVLLSIVALASPAAAQTRLFSDSSEQQVTLEGPFNTLVRRSARNVDPYPAVLTLSDGARFDVQVSARGMFRRISGACNFPPLRIAFQQEQVRGTLFQGQNRLKLVTQCRPNYQHLIVLEYTAYRLYNAITPYSFRAHPLRVTYRDTEGRRREEIQFNYVTEDIDDVAHRNHRSAVQIQSGAYRSEHLDPRTTALVSVFEFMIGNLDWDFLNITEGRACCHNINHLGASQTATDGLIPVPYDFDHSGFVNAPYATPPEGIPIRNVRQRYYRGYCRHNDQLPAVLELFRQHRNEFNAIIDGETRLTDARRRQAHQYIDDFFAIADNPQEWDRQVVQRCRGQPAGSTGAGD